MARTINGSKNVSTGDNQHIFGNGNTHNGEGAVFGNNNTVSAGVTNSFVIGNNQAATQSNTTYITTQTVILATGSNFKPGNVIITEPNYLELDITSSPGSTYSFYYDSANTLFKSEVNDPGNFTYYQLGYNDYINNNSTYLQLNYSIDLRAKQYIPGGGMIAGFATTANTESYIYSNEPASNISTSIIVNKSSGISIYHNPSSSINFRSNYNVYMPSTYINVPTGTFLGYEDIQAYDTSVPIYNYNEIIFYTYLQVNGNSAPQVLFTFDCSQFVNASNSPGSYLFFSKYTVVSQRVFP
jgi:hypothetical protein